MFCSNDCFSADYAVYSMEGVVCSGQTRIHNPKTRKFSTLSTKTGCSHSGLTNYVIPFLTLFQAALWSNVVRQPSVYAWIFLIILTFGIPQLQKRAKE